MLGVRVMDGVGVAPGVELGVAVMEGVGVAAGQPRLEQAVGVGVEVGAGPALTTPVALCASLSAA